LKTASFVSITPRIAVKVLQHTRGNFEQLDDKISVTNREDGKEQ